MYIVLTGILCAVFLAWQTRRLSYGAKKRILITLAALFPLSELAKQIILYRANGCSFNWWYFPFQLCSMPLYLLPVYCLLPEKYRKMRQTLCDFLVDFGLLGGFFAFADVSGMHYFHPLLTVHSYLWHFAMIFLGLFLLFSYKTTVRAKDFLPTGALFLLLTGIATLLNIFLHTKGSINMFYISPYYPMEQIVFRNIALVTGQAAGRFLYIGAEMLGAFLIHQSAGRRMSKKSIPFSQTF